MRFVTHFRCEASESQEETKHPPPCAWRFRIPVSGVAPRWFSWGLAGAYQVQAEVAGLPGPTSERRLNYASLSHSLSGFHKCLTCREGQAPSESSQVPSCCCAHFWKAECKYTCQSPAPAARESTWRDEWCPRETMQPLNFLGLHIYFKLKILFYTFKKH